MTTFKTSDLPRVGFVSPRLPQATVDSEHILTRLRAEGYSISGSYDDADLVVVNTCGFIDAAVEESLDAIGEALAENGKVIVTGCLGAKDDVILAAHPQVLAVTGPHATEEVMHAVHRHLPHPHDRSPTSCRRRASAHAAHYAYLKISGAANHRCSFCIIPSMRGDLVSRPIHEVMREAEALADAGVKELLVISQDTSAYGVDVKLPHRLLGRAPGEDAPARPGAGARRARHLDPAALRVSLSERGRLIPLMAEGKILPYLDVPFQHASPRILKAMKRPANAENVLERVRKWRGICPSSPSARPSSPASRRDGG